MKVTEEIKKRILKLRKEGLSLRKIAKEVNLSYTTVRYHLIGDLNTVSNSDLNSSKNLNTDLNIKETLQELNSSIKEIKECLNHFSSLFKNFSSKFEQQEKRINYLEERVKHLEGEVEVFKSFLAHPKTSSFIPIGINNNTDVGSKDISQGDKEERKEKEINKEKEKKEEVKIPESFNLNRYEKDFYEYFLILTGFSPKKEDIKFVKQIIALTPPSAAKKLVTDYLPKLPDEKKNLEWFIPLFQRLNIRGNMRKKKEERYSKPSKKEDLPPTGVYSSEEIKKLLKRRH